VKRLKDINWNHLYGFFEVARAQSLKAAAEHVGVASSTLSEQLKRLEEEMNLLLFIRSSKGLKLTKDGERLYAHAKEMFETGSRLLDNISQSDIGGYPVTVGIEETISYDIATEFVSQYWDLFTPFGTVNTSRQMESTLLVENILNGQLDWGITLRQINRKNIETSQIGSFELRFMCAEELYDKFIDPLDILRNIPLARSTWDVNLNKTIDQYLKGYDITPKEFITSDHVDYIKKLCRRGRCVMYLAENPLDKYEGLKTFQVGEPMIIHLYALWKKTNENMLSIKKLKELIGSKLTHLPERYKDLDLQIEVSEVSDELLKQD
jgi:LysR family transcriptional regulator, transcriptional activator of nhaA